MTQDPVVFSPLPAQERIHAIDALRGLALLGILLMNIEAMVGPLFAAMSGLDDRLQGADRWVDALVYIFVQGKFYPLFSLLFGMGFAVMLLRARAAGRPFGGVYLRRTLALLVIGLGHAVLVWSGDILVSYALVALVLLFMVEAHGLGLRRWAMTGAILSAVIVAVAFWVGQPTLAFWVPALWLALVLARLPSEGIGLYAVLLLAYVPVYLLSLGLQGSSAQTTAETAAGWSDVLAGKGEYMDALISAQREAYGSGSFVEATAQRWQDLGLIVRYLPQWGWQLLGLFLLGVWFVREGVISTPEKHPRLYARLRWGALPVGLAMTLLSFWQVPMMEPGRMDFAVGSAQALAMAGGMLMCLGYLAWFVRGLASPLGAKVGALLAPAGRMALTNYLTQSLVCTFIFYGYGLGYFGQLPRAWQVPFVLTLFAMQVGFSHAWMAHFRFGPAEWLWRAVTYLKPPPMWRMSRFDSGPA